MNKLTLTLFIIGFSFVNSACDFSTLVCNSAGFTCPAVATITVKNETYPISYLDVLSFGDLTINHGDIEGRVAVRNNFYGSNGISVGDKLNDGLGYSLIVGGNLNFATDGAVYPLDKNFFVGGTVTAPSYLAATDNCSSIGASTGCLNSYFDAAFNYWTQFSSSLTTQSDNVVVSYQSGYGILTCNAAASDYFIHISPSDFSQAIGWCSVGCSAGANFIFNIFGEGDVTFAGVTFQTTGTVIYNIGVANITVSTSVYGNIVAPFSNINMIGGTIYGSVIAGNVSNIIQVNILTTCPVAPSSSSSTSGVVSRQADFCSTLIGSTGSTGSAASGSASGSNSGSSSSGSNDSGSNSGSVATSGSETGSASASASGSASTTSDDSSASGGASPIQGATSAVGNADDTGSASSIVMSLGLIALAVVTLA